MDRGLVHFRRLVSFFECLHVQGLSPLTSTPHVWPVLLWFFHKMRWWDGCSCFCLLYLTPLSRHFAHSSSTAEGGTLLPTSGYDKPSQFVTGSYWLPTMWSLLAVHQGWPQLSLDESQPICSSHPAVVRSLVSVAAVLSIHSGKSFQNVFFKPNFFYSVADSLYRVPVSLTPPVPASTLEADHGDLAGCTAADLGKHLHLSYCGPWLEPQRHPHQPDFPPTFSDFPMAAWTPAVHACLTFSMSSWKQSNISPTECVGISHSLGLFLLCRSTEQVERPSQFPYPTVYNTW